MGWTEFRVRDEDLAEIGGAWQGPNSPSAAEAFPIGGPQGGVVRRLSDFFRLINLPELDCVQSLEDEGV